MYLTFRKTQDGGIQYFSFDYRTTIVFISGILRADVH